MTLYLIPWSLVTVALVWIVMDRVTVKALADRERDGLSLIKREYDQRCKEENDKIDDNLLNQAKTLYGLITEHNSSRMRVEANNYRVRTDIAPLMFFMNPLAEAAWTATANVPVTTPLTELSAGLLSTNPFTHSTWTIYSHVTNPSIDALARLYFLNLPLPEEYLQGVSTSTDYFQVTSNAGMGRMLEWHSKSLDGNRLPFDVKEIDGRLEKSGKADTPVLWAFDTETVNGTNEKVRRIIFRGARQVLPRWGPRGGGPPPPPGPAGTIAGSPPNGTRNPQAGPPRPEPSRPAPPTFDNRLYIQCARPQPQIDEKLGSFADQRGEAEENLKQDIKTARSGMFFQAAAVALVALLAIAVGAPLIISVGLRPVGKLSEAVSRVSEKDFNLPHDGKDLVEELAPIHRRLTQTLDLLRRAFSREKQSVADISHELRTPIAALMATIDVALRKPRTPDQYREALEECRHISKQLGQLVERIMTLACLDAGNDHTSVSRTDALDLAAGCASIIRPLAAANTVSVHLNPPDDVVELDTDSGKLREVLMNLLHNAVEYNRPGGSIDLSVKRERSACVFEIRDSGIGMTPDIKEKIFERFFRADPSRHATGVHAGLGLAIVKEYVARLNGSISVESAPGVGSTFRVTLPALPPEPLSQAEEREPLAAR